MPTYHGSCHCGEVRFRFESEPIRSGVRCNCSICMRKGAVMSLEYLPPERFALLGGQGSLRVYRFGDRIVNHYFCATCGIYPFHDTLERPGWYRVNLGCVEELDALSLPVTVLDWRGR